jgi:WD40 repeat protein
MVLWELLTGRERAGFPAHSLHYTYSKNGLTFSPDGRLLAGSCLSSWEQDKSMLVWDLATRKELGPFRGHLDLVNALAFSPDSGRLATASGDTTVLIWDLGPR